MDFANRAVGALIAWSDYQFRAIGGQNALALVRSAVGQAKLHGITERRTDHGVGDAGVAAGGINDGLAGLERAARQPRLDHAERRPVLYRAAGVKPLGLGAKLYVGEVAAYAVKAEKWRISNPGEERHPCMCIGNSGFPGRSRAGAGQRHGRSVCISAPQLPGMHMRLFYSELDARA